jgi:hypothetical protein
LDYFVTGLFGGTVLGPWHDRMGRTGHGIIYFFTARHGIIYFFTARHGINYV